MPEIDRCPMAIHTTYDSQAAAEAVVRERAARVNILCRAIRCRTCGQWRVVRMS